MQRKSKIILFGTVQAEKMCYTVAKRRHYYDFLYRVYSCIQRDFFLPDP